VGANTARELKPWHFAVLWLALAASLIAWEHKFYFVEEHWEVGDAAANGLQIRQAKYFDELHGNYSRFLFHHPGPAFFYGYAAGEWVLYDLLKVVPSPHNAHVFVGVFVQTGFLAWALAILAKRVRHRLLVPLVLIFAALHFGAVNYNIPHSMYESIWPPYVLLFPFLCFILACASLASGCGKHILPAVTAGCLLVHGHVAQPLFVGPLFIVSCVGFAWRLRASGKPLGDALQHFRRSFIAAAAVLFVFLLPLAIDAFAGKESNLARIFAHFSGSSGDRKSLLQSLNYLGTLLCYVRDPEKFCDVLGPGSLIYASDRWYLVAGWVALAALLVALYRRRSTAPDFTRWLQLHFGLGILLMLVWGIMQSAEMFAFNSHFAFALLFLPLILLAIGVAERVSGRAATYGAVFASIAALPLFVGSAYDWRVWPPISPGPTFHELVTAAKAEPHRKKFLHFQDEDWPWAVGSALMLRRIRMDFRVPTRAGFMFGYDKTSNLSRSIRGGETAIWSFGADPANRSGFQILRGPFVANLPPMLAPTTDIHFAGDELNAAPWAAYGWDLSTGPFSMAVEKSAALYFQPMRAQSDIEMTLDLFPELDDMPTGQRIVISMHKQTLHDVTLSGRTQLTARIPAELWNREPTAAIVFQFPAETAHVGDTESGDKQRLPAIGFLRLTLRELPPP
jgi:hypothetical protein